MPGRGQLPPGPSPGVPRRGPGTVSPAAVGGRESVEGGRGFGVRGSAGGREWETCPQPGLAEAERGAGLSLGAGPGALGRGKGLFPWQDGGVRTHGDLPGPRPGKFGCCVALAAVGAALGGSP